MRTYSPRNIYTDGRKDWYYDEECSNFVKEVDSMDMTNSIFCFDCRMTVKCKNGNCGHGVMLDDPRYFGPKYSLNGLKKKRVDFRNHIIIIKF